MDGKVAKVAVEKARDDDLLSSKQVHAEYGFSQSTLKNWRWMGLGPDYIKTAPGRTGRVLYRRSAIEKWLDEQTVKAGGAAA